MGKVQKILDEDLISFIKQQKIFFTATAPLSAEGMVNTSPKGYGTFTIFDQQTVGYLDYPGSGNETARHIAENGRLTIMFCSFEERPLIVRLLGKGEVIDKSSRPSKTTRRIIKSASGPGPDRSSFCILKRLNPAAEKRFPSINTRESVINCMNGRSIWKI